MKKKKKKPYPLIDGHSLLLSFIYLFTEINLINKMFELKKKEFNYFVFFYALTSFLLSIFWRN